MDKINAIIVEDEQRGMDKLVAILDTYCPNVNIIEKCNTGKSAITAINKHQPQLVFMDIELGGMNGFDVLASLRHISFETIITTGYDEHGIKAVKAGAIDYLLKPIAADELREAVHKVWTKLKENKSSAISKIALADSDGIQLIPFDEIIYCEASNNYTNFILRNPDKTLLISHSLSIYDEKLPEDKFCRISRSQIINMDFFANYTPLDGGSVTLNNGKDFRLKKGVFQSGLKEWLKKYR